MFFPISHSDINPLYLVLVGFPIGILGGFFGVGLGTDVTAIQGATDEAAAALRELGL